MSNKTKKKKGRAMFMKRSSLKVWTDNEGKIHSKATGSIQQIISNYNEMINYMRDQAQNMIGSGILTLGQTPECIIAMVTENPKINPKSIPGGGQMATPRRQDVYPGGGGGSGSNNQK